MYVNGFMLVAKSIHPGQTHAKMSEKKSTSLQSERSSIEQEMKQSPWSKEFQEKLSNRENGTVPEYAYLCIITETNACDSDETVQQTIDTLKAALGTHNEQGIDLISIRVSIPYASTDSKERLIKLATSLMNMKKELQSHPQYNDYKIVMNDIQYLDCAMKANVDGIHVKEKDVGEIPKVRFTLQNYRKNISPQEPIVVGTSAHSVSSAISTCEKYSLDYMFVGTCYMTQSHPEKSQDDLEGPSLPGLVKKEVACMVKSKEEEYSSSVSVPIIFAIGGIEKDNCQEPVLFGADGVAAIRSVMQSSDPNQSVQDLKSAMMARE
ncbi:hypothetical protein CTEN210_00628 [Chaetoceros tenuissimus]|uniref:Thiamine phosphate synthase/TenI domain-containing protein n=1 Tax=Chaetoceros tenuissimus TaxID=426638 RepID=A0AAD3CEH6_9STRA|nr:hypothetical protein CTEN210_00628 [Chaetoceros tenuissimus]